MTSKADHYFFNHLTFPLALLDVMCVRKKERRGVSMPKIQKMPQEEDVLFFKAEFISVGENNGRAL